MKKTLLIALLTGIFVTAAHAQSSVTLYGFTLTNGALGQHGLLFGRQAFAGLSSDQFGTLTFGRQYDSVVDYLAPLAGAGAAKGGVFFGHPYDNDNLQNTMRINNAVKYASPNFNGWRFGGLYGFSNAGGGCFNKRADSLGACEKR